MSNKFFITVDFLLLFGGCAMGYCDHNWHGLLLGFMICCQSSRLIARDWPYKLEAQ